MHWIISVSDVFSISTGRILFLMTWVGLVRVSHSCQILGCRWRLSFFGHLSTFVALTPVKTILELFRPAFGVLPKTGEANLVENG